MKVSKKKAFTLTELLVVVIIIGVLSAVVLPKFNKIVETRKTTEAEELMAAVRTEQEKRCALDKNYLTDSAKLTDVLTSTSTKNFDYSLTSTGMKATSKGKYAYELQMPSYEDGRICCANETECLKLNKDYPLCSELIAKADYQDGSACEGEASVPSVIQCSGSSTQSCGCNGGGTQTRTCNTSTGTWSSWSACSISEACECTGTKPTTSQVCNGCGTQTRSVSCDTSSGQWIATGWGSCSKTLAECIDKSCDESLKPMASQDCGYCGTQTRSVTCDTSTGTWTTGGWTKCNQPSTAVCEAGTYSTTGGNTCTGTSKVQIAIAQELAAKETVEAPSLGLDDGLGTGTGTTTSTYDSGRKCNASCQWEKIACPSSSSGGGG
ncbi:MAG: type II secretion system protein, partial [Elusimicrobiaceae bacterium]|nr:type II secretion system protein [Elusimicrobiaceae bacterium]